MSNTQEHPQALICGNLRCAKQLAGWVSFCPYCGTAQLNKVQLQAKTEVEQAVTKLEREPLEFDHATKRTEDAERLKAVQDSKVEQQAKDEQAAAEDKRKANAKAVREMAEQADTTVTRSVPGVGAHQGIDDSPGKSTSPFGLVKKAAIFLLLVGLGTIGFMTLKSKPSGSSEGLPAQENLLPAPPETKIKSLVAPPKIVPKPEPVTEQPKLQQKIQPKPEPATEQPTVQPKIVPKPEPVTEQPVRQEPEQPTVQPAQPKQNEKVIQLLGDAKKFIAQGNYKQAEESMKFCEMIDESNQDCQRMKQKAAQLNDKMFDCVSAGKEWVGERCN